MHYIHTCMKLYWLQNHLCHISSWSCTKLSTKKKENWKWHFSLHPYDTSTVVEQGTKLWRSAAIFWTLAHKTAPRETTFWSAFHVSSEGLKQEGKLGLSKSLIIDVVKKGLESDLQSLQNPREHVTYSYELSVMSGCAWLLPTKRLTF